MLAAFSVKHNVLAAFLRAMQQQQPCSVQCNNNVKQQYTPERERQTTTHSGERERARARERARERLRERNREGAREGASWPERETFQTMLRLETFKTSNTTNLMVPISPTERTLNTLNTLTLTKPSKTEHTLSTLTNHWRATDLSVSISPIEISMFRAGKKKMTSCVIRQGR